MNLDGSEMKVIDYIKAVKDMERAGNGKMAIKDFGWDNSEWAKLKDSEENEQV